MLDIRASEETAGLLLCDGDTTAVLGGFPGVHSLATCLSAIL